MTHHTNIDLEENNIYYPLLLAPSMEGNHEVKQ